MQPTTMAGLVAAYQRHINPAALLDDVAWISSIDRLQGSTGLDRLADGIAARAHDSGLDVTLRRYPPGTRWWGFTAPRARSPIAAAIHLPGGQVTAYPDQPFCLARGSASLPPADLPVAVLDHDPAGALVICPPQPRFALTPLINTLHAAGAAALAVESPAGPFDQHVVGRLEVPDDCPLPVFSVSAAQAAQLRAAAGTPARVHATHEPAAPTATVLARHHGQPGRPRALLIAHLCHPAPSANDNATGCAALLAIGDALTRLYPAGTGPTVDLLWGPEMVGTSAYLHELGVDDRPDFVFSLDMIGGPGHLLLEDTPDHCPAPLAAAVEAAVRHISPPQVSYSGAVQLPTWPRAVTPFVGASDHLLFADPSIAIPSAHVSCGPDPAHHTSYDTMERILPGTLTNTTIAAAAATTALCLGGAALSEITTTHHDLDAARLPPERHDPDLLAHRQTITSTALNTMNAWHQPATEPRAQARPGSLATAGASAVVRCWEGPWNLNNLIEAADEGQRRRLANLLQDPGPGYARLAGIALAINDRLGRVELIQRARWATGLAITDADASGILTMLRDLRWINCPAD